ncbi:MAG: type II secretion system protein N [Thalassolituus sp.]|uniref:type II secretion system protein N n=1 Tax=Thalassolituus TaxID=187492 RepID=UPI001CE39952|nr:type II secretion system protein N [Thalassolituus oleivorans]MCA6126578.1 hypothetical protein [Thalassolituus oleivorans 4BN06-13]
MLQSIWAARWYLLLGILTFLIVLVVNTPLHFIWQYAEPALGRMPIRIQNPTGTLWHGRLIAEAPEVGPVQVTWRLSPLSLLSAQPELNLSVDNERVRLHGDAAVTVDLATMTPSSIILTDVSGYLDSQVAAKALKSMRVSVKGDAELSQLNGEFDLVSKQVLSLAGRLIYSGGNVQFPVQRNQVDALLPMLIGEMGMEDDTAVMNVKTPEGKDIARVFLQADGWGGASMRKRAVDLVGQQWPDKQATEDTVIFEVSHKIL